MEIVLRDRLGKWIAIVIAFGLFSGLVIWLGKVYVATQLAATPTVANLERAVRLDPNNAGHHLLLGRIFQYNVAEINLDRAIEQLQRAVELNPRDPQPWLELGVAMELHGRRDEAEACLQRADFLGPHIPGFQWAIGNFFLLHDNVDEAFRHFRVVLAGTSEYNHILFDTAWKASGDSQKILQQLLPARVATEFDYLYYLLARRRYPEAREVWARIARNSERFPPYQAAAYIDALIEVRQPQEALRVWDELRGKGLIPATYELTGENLVLNGDFEEDVLNMGFDWRMPPIEGVYAGVDSTVFHSPGRSLLIQFGGKHNVDYRHAYQYARVEPRRSYRLRAFLRAAGITTDSGPRLEVRDAYDPGALLRSSEGLTGSTTGWTLAGIDFTTGPKTGLIVVSIVRPPSRKFDNLIAGRVWVDDISLTEGSALDTRRR